LSLKFTYYYLLIKYNNLSGGQLNVTKHTITTLLLWESYRACFEMQ